MHQGHLALTRDTFSAASGIVAPPPPNSSNHPDDSTDTTSQRSTAFSDNSTEGNGPIAESFQLRSLLEQPPSHDSVPEGRQGCLGRPPAAETVAHDPEAARMTQMQAFLDDIDRRLRSASHNGAPHDDEGNTVTNNETTDDDDTDDTPDDNHASDSKQLRI